MKKLLFSSMLTLMLTVVMTGSVPVFAQTAGDTITCIPVQQPTRTTTQIECRITTFQSEAPNFLVAELAFPFHVTKLVKVSSSYSATLGTIYPPALVNNTVSVAAVGWGNETIPAHIQAIPLDSLSFLLETDQSMSDVKKAFATPTMTMSVLAPFSGDPANPVFLTVNLQKALLFDNSLILESVTQYVSPSVLQFLRLGLACYEKTPQQCFDGILQNL